VRRIPEAGASYEKALALAQHEPDRRFLARRLEELQQELRELKQK
jgi:predicted RNA polymerase sigma factor